MKSTILAQALLFQLILIFGVTTLVQAGQAGLDQDGIAHALGKKGTAEVKADFKGETPGGPSSHFGPTRGNWHIDKDGNTIVYAADGRKKGTAFPVSIFKGLDNFRGGAIGTSFKPISGKEDQAAGIAFNVKSTGDYLVVRANALEDNLILFKVERGRRSSLNEVNNVPAPSGRWHDLKVVINGKK